MSSVSEKAKKVLNLALAPSAPEGEWNAAAIRFIFILRKQGQTVESIGLGDKSERSTREHKPRQTREKKQPAPKSAPIPTTMPFGKFKGQSFGDLPDWYLVWLIEQDFVKDPLRSKVAQEIETREGTF